MPNRHLARRFFPLARSVLRANMMKAQSLAEIIEETAQIAYVRDTSMAAHGKAAADPPNYGTAADARAASE